MSAVFPTRSAARTRPSARQTLKALVGITEGCSRRTLLTARETCRFFVFSSQAVVSEECVPVDQFVEHLLPSLLSLASDPVPNVRVLLAKALRQTLLDRGRYTSSPSRRLSLTRQRPREVVRVARRHVRSLCGLTYSRSRRSMSLAKGRGNGRGSVFTFHQLLKCKVLLSL